MNELETIQKVKDALIALEKQYKKFKKLSDKSANVKPFDVTQRQWDKIQANLNWEAMYLEQRKIDLARAYKGSSIETGTEQHDFYPSSFHHYKY